MPRNRLLPCIARPLLPAKTGTRIPRVVLIYLQTGERPHKRYSLLGHLGLIPLGHLHLRPLQRHFHSQGPIVLANLLRQWQDLSFLTSGIRIRPFQAEFMIFTPLPRAGAPIWGILRFLVLGPIQTTGSISTVWNSKR